MLIRTISTAVAFGFGLVSSTMAAENMAREDILNGFRKNAAMTQLHRWYLLYEEPRYGIENQLDILTKDVTVKSGLGVANGHEEYATRVKQIPAAWKNAHNVKSVKTDIKEDGTIALSAEVTYLNQGALEGGAVRTAELTYTTTLQPAEGVLPKFSSIEIAQNSDGTADEFSDAYGENRMRAVVHYWLALIEDPARDPEPVREILADEFSLNFSSGKITDFDGFKAWLAGPGSSVKASTHVISDFSQEKLEDGTYRVAMTFDWNGYLPDDTKLGAQTRHTWLVEDDPTQRFARIRSMEVEVLEPFAPIN